MKKWKLICSLCIFQTCLFAQKFEWAKSMGGINPDQVNSLATDSFENVYTAGYFHEKGDFDPNDSTYELSTTGNRGIFISKLDKSGNFVWAKSFGGDNDIAFALSLDHNNNIYTTGWFENTIDFDPGPDTFNLTSDKFNSVFILKLDFAGHFVWAKTIGAYSGRSVSNDVHGNVYVAGYFTDTVDFDPGPGRFFLYSKSKQDVFLLKLDSDGNFIWAKNFGGTKQGYQLSIASDYEGNIYTTGAFEGSVDFDPGSTDYYLNSKGRYDIFILKLDSSGNFIWAKSIGSSGDDMGFSIDVDSLSNVYIAGSFMNSVDFNPDGLAKYIKSSGDQDAFILNLDASGTFRWVHSLGGKSDDGARAISINQKGDIYSTGFFSDTIYFDGNKLNNNLISVGGGDVFILKLDYSGNIRWLKAFGGTDWQDVASIKANNKGHLLIAGNFYSQSEYDPGTGNTILIAAGVNDIFVLKLDDDFIIKNNDLKSETTFYVSPVPSSDFLNVKVNSEMIGLPYAIIDLTGKTILNGIIDHSFYTIDISRLNEYLYFMYVGGCYKKIIKL